MEREKDCIIIEVAHQSNFLPYSGVWKKAVFADSLATILKNNGTPAVPLFGFFDQDTSMNKFLYSNVIPFLSADGYKKIGFKIKGENEWWRAWCNQPSPSEEVVKKKINEILSLYVMSGLNSTDMIL